MKILLLGALALGSLAIGLAAGTGSRGPAGEDQTVRVNDIAMSCRIYGQGDPLVMIMGYGSTMNLWEEGLLKNLAARFQVIVFDNRGIGGTEAGERAFSIEQFADDAAGLLDALGRGRAHVMGWSMGAMIAQELARRHPGKVNKLVLYAAHCDAELYPPAPEVIRKLTDTSGTQEEQGMRFISLLFPPEWLQSHGERLKEIFFRPMGEIRPEILAKQSQAIDAWKSGCGLLDRIHNSTLIIAGEADVLVPPQNSRYLAGKIPRARLDLIEGAGHGLMFQVPEVFCEKVIGFLMEKSGD